MEKIKLMKTNKGNGFKVVVDGKWYYTSTEELYSMLADVTKICEFANEYEEKA